MARNASPPNNWWRSAGAALLAAFLTTSVPVHADPPEKALPCLVCHGAEGTSELETVPSLGAQKTAYNLVQLFMFREGLRVGEPMNELMRTFSDDDLRTVAAFLTTLPKPKPSEDPVDTARFENGRLLSVQNRCVFCHRADLSGQESVPRVGAQREDYLLKTLRDYKSGARRGYEATMAEALQSLADPQLVDLAHYLAHSR